MTDKSTFETALKELEGAVEALESGDLSLEDSLKWFEKGVGSAALCRKLLGEVEARVDVLLRDSQGNLKTESFDE